jgi:2'-5' RNA ligase
MQEKKTSLIVLAYPKISDKNYKWIQSIREQNDKNLCHVVGPHFTLVFPTLNFDIKSITDHISMVVESVKPIQFSIHGTTIVKNPFRESTNLFLIADQGNSDIIKLHDKLYTGVLFKELRLDIPFIPHITIGEAKDPLELKRLSDDLNGKRFSIDGIINEITLEELDLTESEYPKAKSIRKFRLK